MVIGTAEQPRQPQASPRPKTGVLRRVVHGVGELFITLGAVSLLFVFHEVYVTDWISAGKQLDATTALENRWAADAQAHRAELGRAGQATAPAEPAVPPPAPRAGEGIARLYAPRLGPDFAVTVIEGTVQDILAVGPGHYVGTALPGQPGNFAVAGHRVGRGAPFNDLDLLQSCDALVVETASEWLVYRILPFAAELPGWAEGKGTEGRCRGVTPLSAPYPQVPGQEIVLPTNGTVVAPVPGQPRNSALPPGARARLITLTTCNPKFSARTRLVVHGLMVARYVKGGERPAELQEG